MTPTHVVRNVVVMGGLCLGAYHLLLDDEARKKAETTVRQVYVTVKELLEKIESLRGTTDESDEMNRVLSELEGRWARIGY